MVEKNIKKKQAKKQRNMSGFNTGNRTHKDPRHPSRNDRKIEFMRYLKEEY